MTKKKTTKKKVSKKKAVKKTVKKKTAVKKTKKKSTKKKRRARGRVQGLTDQKKAFCKEYIIDFKVIRAVMAVSDCTEESASVMASRWLDEPCVQEYLAKITKKREERLDMKADVAMKECMRIALADVGDAFDEDGRLLRIREIPIELRRCISGFEVEALYEGKGKDKLEIGTLTKVKFWSKDKNLELLFKHHGLLEKDNKQQAARGTLLIINRPGKK